MQLIHFTRGATDPIDAFEAKAANFVQLAHGDGETYIGCAHLDPDATVTAPPLTHASALLVVHGAITVIQTAETTTNTDVRAGMGAVFDGGEAYTLHSDRGAIFIIVETEELNPHPRGISTEERIAGANWPGDAPLAQ